MDNINKTFNLRNGKKYIIELNDISEYLKEIKKSNILASYTWIFTFIFSAICLCISITNIKSLYQIFFGILGMTMFFICFFILDKSSNYINESGVDIGQNIDCINRFETECNDIDFSKPINIDEDYNILYFNKNQGLQTLYINYDDIQYVADSDNTIKLIGKYIGNGEYKITLYLPVEMSNEYKNYIEKS